MRKLALLLVFLIIFVLALPAYAIFCSKCGTQNPDDAVFCSKCGTKLYHPLTSQEKPDIYTQSSDLIEKEKADEAILLLEPYCMQNQGDAKAEVLLAEAYLYKCYLLKRGGDEEYEKLVWKPFEIGKRYILQRPNWAEGYYICANSFLINDRARKADKYIEKAIELSPNTTPESRYHIIWAAANTKLALRYNDDMRYRKATKICREIIEMNAPKNDKALAYYWLGILYSKFSSKEQAIENLNSALNYAEKESTRMTIQEQLASIQK